MVPKLMDGNRRSVPCDPVALADGDEVGHLGLRDITAAVSSVFAIVTSALSYPADPDPTGLSDLEELYADLARAFA